MEYPKSPPPPPSGDFGRNLRGPSGLSTVFNYGYNDVSIGC